MLLFLQSKDSQREYNLVFHVSEKISSLLSQSFYAASLNCDHESLSHHKLLQ